MTRASLLRRILPPLAGAVAFLTLAVTFVGVRFMHAAVLDRARQRAVTLSTLEAERLESLMRSGEHRNLQHLVERLKYHPDVAGVRILEASGVVHASSQPSEIGRPGGVHARQQESAGDAIAASLNGTGESPVVVHTFQPFLNRRECQQCHNPAQRVVGGLDLDVAVNPHVIGLMTFTSLSALLGLLYLVAVIGVAGPLVALVVGRPMRRLSAALHQVQGGDLDVQVEPSGTREIDGVFAGFNHMVAQLRRGRAAEEEARRLELERAQQLASVGELAAGLAHEIRNPLSGVKAVIEVVGRETADEDRRDVLRDAGRELARIDQIVRDLLQYARPKAPVIGAFALNSLVDHALKLTFPATPEHETRARADLAPDLPPALGDEAQVRQVLVNLLLNADQAAGTQGHVTVTTGTREGRVYCSVQDSGPGVPADQAGAIFRPFMTTKARGTGLGLSISRRAIELQGGTLTLDNPGRPGASFTFTLPVLRA